jgi:hypothetical protein
MTKSPSRLIDERIKELDDWRGETAEGSFRPLQLEPGGQHPAGHRLSRGREDQYACVEGSHSRRGGAERVEVEVESQALAGQ